MTDALATSNGRRSIGRYTLLEKLGAGGQGEVWRAHDPSRGIDVALKILDVRGARVEAVWAAIQREYAIASRLDHPGILKLYPPERDGDQVLLPMEIASGGDMRRLRGASYLEIVPVLIEIAQALEHAHERGVIHRDLKPGNVLFDARGRVKLADFGVSGTSLTGADSVTGVGGGSPFTASPAQLRGEPPSVADDIYGLGALAYELLSGYPPHYPKFDPARVLDEPVPPLRPIRQTPPQLTSLVMRMLEKRAELRPRSMREVIDELDVALNDTLAFEFDDVVGAAPTISPAPSPGPRVDFPKEPIVARPAVSEPASFREVPRAEPIILNTPPPVVSPPPARTATPWADLRIEPVPGYVRLEPIRAPRRWPWVALTGLVAVAFAVFFWLPEYAPKDLTSRVSAMIPPLPSPNARDRQLSPAGAMTSSQPAADAESEAKVREARAAFDERLAALESRAAGAWGGREFAMAKTRAAEAVGAYDAGNPRLAAERLQQALELLDQVESKAPEALKAQIEAGERALEAGQEAVAAQAFTLALRIDPNDQKAAQGLRRVSSLERVLPLLADAANAEAEGDYARAVQGYSQALELDPGNTRASEGLKRATASLGNDSYAKAVGAGFSALEAGQLERAREAFEKARSIRPSGSEATAGLQRVNAAMRARGFAAARQRAVALEAEERWEEALREYEKVLEIDPSLAFAQQGRERTAERARLARRLQTLIDQPGRLAAPSVREEARQLIEYAKSISPSGPVLRSQVARLEILLPEFDKPVRLALVSDNSTHVAISHVGTFGTFTRREIELKPGKYTVIGTREGYRDVRREITVAPGQETQTISVACVEPI